MHRELELGGKPDKFHPIWIGSINLLELFSLGAVSDSQPSILDRFLKDAAATALKSDSYCDTETTRPLSSYTYESDNQVVPSPSIVHKFTVQTFTTPKKCIACSSLMVGLMRQGYSCGGKGRLCLRLPDVGFSWVFCRN